MSTTKALYWAQELYGPEATVFGYLPIGAMFTFPKDSEVLVKCSKKHFMSEGKKYTLKEGAVVKELKNVQTTGTF